MAINVTIGRVFLDSIMTDDQYTLSEGMLCIVRGTLACLGVAANIANVRTFVAMGPRNGMTICFLSLALSYLAYLATVIARATFFAFMTVETLTQLSIWFPVEPYGVYIYFGHAGRIPYIMSNITTAFLAVVRCLCVAKPLPLLFKNMFGTRITLLALTVSEMFSIVSYLPVLIYMGMTTQAVPGHNETRPTLWISPKREEVKDVVWAIRDAFIPFATQIIIIISLAILTTKLRAANRFRRTHTRQFYSSSERILKSDQDIDEASPRYVKVVSSKELQVIKQVVLISTVYIVCNTPTILINFAGVYDPQFSIEKLYRNLYLTVTGVKHLCQTINASFNIFIYSKFNSKYRKTLFS